MSNQKMSLSEAFSYINDQKGKQVFSDAKLLGAMLTDLVGEDKNLIPFIVQSSTNHYFDFLARCSTERIQQAVDDAVKRVSGDYQDAITDKIEEAFYYAFGLGVPKHANRGKKDKDGAIVTVSSEPVQTALGASEELSSINSNNNASKINFAAIGLIIAAAVILAVLFVVKPWQKNTVSQQTDLETMNENGTDPIVTENETPSPEPVLVRTDLTGMLSDISVLNQQLQGIERKESGEFEHWYQDLNDQFGYGNYEKNDTVDMLWFISDQYKLFDLYIGQQLEEGVQILNQDNWLLNSNAGYSYVMEKDDLTLSLTKDTDGIIQQIELSRTPAEQYIDVGSVDGDHSGKKTDTGLDDSYFFPNSLDELLSESQLYGMSARELTLARNEVFARYGYTFKRQDLQEYFNTKSWYHADPAVNPDTISGIVGKIGMQNMVMIREYQKRTGLTW